MGQTLRLLKTTSILAFFASNQANGQLFQQNFALSDSVHHYVGAPPNDGQFDYIGTSGSGTVVSIQGGTLQFDRTGNAGFFARSTNFSPTPDILKVEFNLSVPSASTNTAAAAILRFGQNFTPDNGASTNGNSVTRLGINLVNGGGFQLRDIGPPATNTPTFIGSPLITIFINNSGSTLGYLGPDGQGYYVEDRMNDVWVDSTLMLDDMPAPTTSTGLSLTDMKFNFSVGTGAIRFDNFNITTGFALPVEFTHFSATPDRTDVLLRWRTASEENNDRFEVEHSTDGQRFAAIGRVAGNGTTTLAHDYSFWHRSPAPGTNYYRLRQVDFDGTEHFSPVRTAVFGDANDLRLSPNPASERLHVRFEKEIREDATWAVAAADGKALRSGPFPAETTELEIPVADLPEGLYCLKINTSRQSWAGRFLKLKN